MTEIGIFVALILGGASPEFPHRATSTIYCTGHLSLLFPHFRDVECFGTGNFRARHRPEILQNSLPLMCVMYIPYDMYAKYLASFLLSLIPTTENTKQV